MTNEEWEGLLNSRIITAYTAGLSVVEITRALGKIRVDSVHSLLRETGHIPAMARSEYRRTYQIDQRLADALLKMGYSFGRWCLGWQFGPEAAVADLGTAPEEESSTATHETVRRDYPVEYFRMFGGNKPQRRPRKTEYSTHPALSLDWDHTRGRYVATVLEYPDIKAFGVDWAEAAEEAKAAYRFQEYIRKLNNAIAEKKSINITATT